MDGDARDDARIPHYTAGVPDPVSNAARALYADAVKRGDRQSLEVLKRLVTDLRMQRAWGELVKRTRKEYRSTATFLRPARAAWGIPEDTIERQHIAIGSLLYLAVNLVVDSPRVMTRQQVETARRKALDDASALRTAAKLFSPPDPALNAAQNREGRGCCLGCGRLKRAGRRA